MTDQSQGDPLRALHELIGSEPQPSAALDAAKGLSPERLAILLSDLTTFHKTAQELDAAKKDIDRLNVRIRGYEARERELSQALKNAEARIDVAYEARDKAIAERAMFESLFMIVRRTLDEATLPEPLLPAGFKSTLSLEVTRTPIGTKQSSEGDRFIGQPAPSEDRVDRPIPDQQPMEAELTPAQRAGGST